MSANLALQKAMRARLVATSAVTDLVPASNILDRHSRPAPDPAIVLGEDQSITGDDLARKQEQVISTIHIWKKEPSTVGVKAIAGALRTTLHASRLQLETGFHCGDCHVISMRFLRDPDGETSHGIITLDSIVESV